MRILFVHPATTMSIGDVARGYRAALERQDHEIADYNLGNRLAYHKKAFPVEVLATPDSTQLLARAASETIFNEALYNRSELVIIVSGLNCHPIALWLLAQADIPAAVIFTESPYDDDNQAQWANLSHVGVDNLDLACFTNDRYSAARYGWGFLAPAYDPAVHRPVDADDETACDVLMVGTGWPERQKFLEAIDWTGINLRLYGIWPGITPDSVLHQFHYPMVVNNAHIAGVYSSAKICINFHRASPVALTPGPRLYETAACLAFQLSDHRQDMDTVFGDSVPTFETPIGLEMLIRHYLANPDERKICADKAYNRVEPETFDKRAAEMMAALARRAASKQLVT